jgi:hypothetical protein
MLRNRGGAALGALLGFALLAGLLVLAAVLNLSGRDEPDLAGVALGPNEAPVAGGEMATLEEAVRFLPVPFFRPDDELASDNSFQDLWVVADDTQVYARYTTGITLKVRPAAGELSNEEWAASLAHDGIEGGVETIGGIDVFIVPQNLPSYGSSRFILNGVLVTLIGEGDFSVESLRRLAESVIATADKVEAEKESVQ